MAFTASRRAIMRGRAVMKETASWRRLRHRQIELLQYYCGRNEDVVIIWPPAAPLHRYLLPGKVRNLSAAIRLCCAVIINKNQQSLLKSMLHCILTTLYCTYVFFLSECLGIQNWKLFAYNLYLYHSNNILFCFLLLCILLFLHLLLFLLLFLLVLLLWERHCCLVRYTNCFYIFSSVVFLFFFLQIFYSLQSCTILHSSVVFHVSNHRYRTLLSCSQFFQNFSFDCWEIGLSLEMLLFLQSFISYLNFLQ